MQKIINTAIFMATLLLVPAHKYPQTPQPAPAILPRTETEWAEYLAPKYHVREEGIEYKLFDGTRVDWLTETRAFELDWVSKQYEAFGQATYYAHVTGRQPHVFLLVKDQQKEKAHMYRAHIISKILGIPYTFYNTKNDREIKNGP